MSKIEELRSQIEGSQRGKSAGAIRYRAKLRGQVVAHAKSAMACGETPQSIAACLGIAAITLRRWMRPVADCAPLLPVVLAAPDPSASGCVLVSPNGYRVEGLSVDEAAHLLAMLA